jgi:hypothetical protein
MKLLSIGLAIGLVACAGDERDADLETTYQSALVTKENPTVTAQMRDKMATLRAAYVAHDDKAYRAALIPLLVDATKQKPADLLERYASLQVIAAETYDGYQPMIYRYAKSIFANQAQVDPNAIKELRADTYLARASMQSPLAGPCGQVVRDALHGDFPEIDDLAGLACLGTDPEIHAATLTTQGLALTARNACENLPNYLVYRFDVPSAIPTANITALETRNLPWPGTLATYQDYANRRWVSVSVHQFPDPLPADAQTETFQIRVTTTTGFTDYPVTIPINRAIHASCSTGPIDVGIGNAQNRPIYGNGSRTPARTWSQVAAPGSGGLPSGLSFAPGTGGHAVVTGTVGASAVDGSIDVTYLQSATPTTQRLAFRVLLRPDPVRVAQLAAPIEIQRGQAVSVALPSVAGGTGTYTWAVGVTGAALPAGLSLVHIGSTWSITGTVSNTLPFKSTTT